MKEMALKSFSIIHFMVVNGDSTEYLLNGKHLIFLFDFPPKHRHSFSIRKNGEKVLLT